jgi:hypothetical protein
MLYKACKSIAVRHLALCIFSIFSLNSFSQASLQQIIVVNGGVFGDPVSQVTLASVSADLSGYFVFDTIDTEASQDIHVRGNRAWVAALDSLVLYDLDNYQRVAAIALSGVNKIETFGDKILVGRGFGASSDFLQVRDSEDLSLVSNIPVSAETGGILTTPTHAYVAVPADFFSTEGKLAVIDLISLTLEKEIDLGAAGNGIDALFWQNGQVIAICPGSSRILAIDPETEIFDSRFLGDIASYPGAARYNDKIYFQYGDFFAPNLGVFDLATATTENSALIPGAFAAVEIDPLSGSIYRTSTDFFSSGMLHRHSNDGSLINEISIGISAEQIGLDIRGNCHTPENVQAVAGPSILDISWDAVTAATSYRVSGRLLGSGISSVNTTATSLNLSSITAGSYEYSVKALCGSEESDFATVQLVNVPLLRESDQKLWSLQNKMLLWLDEDVPELSVFDAQGRLMHRGVSNSVSASSWPAGIYFLSYETEQGSQSQSVVLQ